MPVAEPRLIVVKNQTAPTVSFGFLAGGIILLSFPYCFGDNECPLWVKLLCYALGGLAIMTGLFAWRYARFEFVLDRQGLWCQGQVFRGLVLVPWDDVVSARLIHLTTPRGELEGTLVGLQPDARHPLGGKGPECMRRWLEANIGPVDFPNPVVVGFDEDAETDWTLSKIVEQIRRCLSQPEERAQLAFYRPPKPVGVSSGRE
jgi:hypothetical protein